VPLEELLRALWRRRGRLALLSALLFALGAAPVLLWPRSYVAQAVVAPAETTGIATSALLSPVPLLSRLAWSGQRKRPVIPCADLGGDTEYGRQVARGGGRGAETRLG